MLIREWFDPALFGSPSPARRLRRRAPAAVFGSPGARPSGSPGAPSSVSPVPVNQCGPAPNSAYSRWLGGHACMISARNQTAANTSAASTAKLSHPGRERAPGERPRLSLVRGERRWPRRQRLGRRGCGRDRRRAGGSGGSGGGAEGRAAGLDGPFIRTARAAQAPHGRGQPLLGNIVDRATGWAGRSHPSPFPGRCDSVFAAARLQCPRPHLSSGTGRFGGRTPPWCDWKGWACSTARPRPAGRAPRC